MIRSASRQRGVLALWTAVLLPIVIMLLALVIESAYLFALRRAQQTATDLAAQSGALQALRENAAGVTAAARYTAAENGFPVAAGTTVTPWIDPPPSAHMPATNSPCVCALSISRRGFFPRCSSAPRR
jgi:uncharacterized membrane protein